MTVRKTLVGLTAVALMAAGPAFASPDVDAELAEMRQMVEGLKQRVEAQEEQIEHQGALLEDAQKVVREQQVATDSLSALGEFWEAIDVNMSVAGSYAWNFANPNSGGASGINQNIGTTGGFYPFHQDHNSFQVDQVWLEIGKEATEESRAGFQFTILYGNTAFGLGQGSPVGARGLGVTGDSASDYYVHEAYVSYLAPVGDGVAIDFGKFATVVGAETADAAANWNITRGNVYNLLQPIDHTGLIGSTDVGPLTLTAGIVNQGTISVSSPDFNTEKTYIWGAGFSPMDNTSFAATVLYGTETPLASGKKQGLLDVVLSHEGDGFSAWINADYIWFEGSRLSAWGIAVAGLVPISDELSVAGRVEYVQDETAGGPGGFYMGDFLGIGGPGHSEVWGVTGTVAYELAENLTLKGELRWDKAWDPKGGGKEFLDRSATGKTSQLVGLGQLVYSF